MTRRAETMLSAAFAVWGLAIAIALITVFERPAPADQLPGLAKSLGFDAHGPFRWIAALMLLPIVVPFVLRPIARRLSDGAAWARNAALIAPLVTLWLVTVRQDVLWTLLPCALVLAACTFLRRRELHFTRRDVVLIPTFMTALLGVMDVKFMTTTTAIYIAALLVLGLRIAVSFIRSPLPPALAFIAAPLGLVLQTGFFARDQRYFGWHALAVVAITPFVLRFLLKDARRAIAILTFAIYPIALYSYSNAVSTVTAEGRPRVNFFEDGHALLPASEYLRGELPYRDILPAHGLFEDGYFDYLVMRAGDVSIGARAKARDVVGNLACVAMYFLALAATGSAEGAFFAVLLSFLTGVYRGHVRLVVPVLTLACIAFAVRWRRWRWFAVAAFGCVLSGIISLDFAAYTFLTLVVAVLRNRRALRPALLGLACGVVPLVAILALCGILGDFIRGTFVETLAAGPAYTLNFFTPPAALAKLRAFPDVLAALLDRDSFLYLFWCAAAVFVGVTVTRRASRRLEPIVLIGVWIVATAISYAERHHLYFGMVAAVVIVYLILRLLRRQRTLAVAIIVALIALSGLTIHAGIVGWMRHARGPLDAAWLEIPNLPRARGAYFHERDAAFLASAQKYLSLTLRPDETFLDFTNSGLLYFLLRRDCPLREYEVAFYESEAQQREVIRRIEANPKVKAVLVPATPGGRFTIDGVPNADRAPLVWQYLQARFQPDFAEGEVAFWRRR
jgi:xanthosine utilization system XapX-like protein